MTPERWQQIRDVLAQVLEAAPTQRAAVLDQACSSDHSLRQEVESLLSSSDDVHSSFMESRPPRMTLPAGTKLGEYEIKSLLGSGGMGEVYRARDARLGRDVAIKVLPSSFQADAKRLWRFEQEARAAAALNHPNILAVFQMGTYEGMPYLVSELLEGETLREQLNRGRLAVRKAIDYGLQVAHGLMAAHEKGIVHRDLKPANLFVTEDGRVKILDFGLAKLTRSLEESGTDVPGPVEQTLPGVVMGTIGYMSPEQVRGEKADHRTDVFSFGAILYEMLTGKRAFQKPTSAETLSAILNEDPPAISQVAANVPPALERVVFRCLEKNPERRFRSASDLGFALEVLSESPERGSVGAVAKATKPRTSSATAVWVTAMLAIIAVAGFAAWFAYHRRAIAFHAQDTVLVADCENQTGDPQLDDALNVAFTVSLAQSRYASVFPRSRFSAVLERMGRSGNERVTATLGREICLRENVRGLIASTITRSGQQYEIVTQLIDPETDATVRAYTERSYGEDHILDALDSIAGRIRADLGESLKQIHSSNQPLPQVTTSSLTALKLYAEARSLWSHTKYDEAVSLYKSAVELDPDFAMAHAALGRAYCSHIYYQMELCRQEYGKAQSLKSRLTEREKMLLDARAALDLDRVEEAYRLYSSFLARYPEDWAVLREYANLLRRHGRVLEAIEQHKRILAIAPDDAHTWIEMATANSGLGRFSDAVQAYSQAFRFEPDLLTAGNINREYGMALVGNGEEPKAVTVFSDLLRQPAQREDGLCSLAMLDLFHGRYMSAQGRFQDALPIDESAHDTFNAARIHFWLAVIADGRGDNRTRLRELDASVADLKNLGPKVAWGALVGEEYVRAGALAKAESIAGFISPIADPHDDEEIGYVGLLRASIAAGKGQTAEATQQLLLLTDPAHGASVNALASETLAYTYQHAGQSDQAIPEYEKFAAPVNSLTFWEPQQRWAVSRYTLASDYVKQGQVDKAKQTLTLLLELWKDSDADLPLRKAALELQTQLAH